MKLLLLTAVIAVACISGEQVRYDNYAVYRFSAKNESQLSILQSLQKMNKFDFWTEPRHSDLPVDIMVPPESKQYIENFMSEHEISFKIMMDDVQKHIDGERLLTSNKTLGFDFESYHSVDEIYDWLKQLAQDYPQVTLIKGGESYEGRDILGVKVSYSSGNANSAIWIDSLIHAREWITGATTTYILNELLTSKQGLVRLIAESHDWYFFPVINPDGYEYSRTTDRMWRKTRTPYGECFGVDANRNWGYKWNEGGSSADPCDETYAGPKAFSEKETSSLSAFMEGIAKDIKLFQTYHSYSQLILLPYGHTTDHLDNYDEALSVGKDAARVLEERHGTHYKVGNIVEAINYIATGSNMDWLKANYHVQYAYAYELRDTGRFGFLLPESQIIPTGEETLDALVETALML